MQLQQTQTKDFYTKPLSLEVQRKLELSLKGCRGLDERELRCPRCGQFIATLYSDTSGHLKIKCKKCKYITTYDTRCFRRTPYRRPMKIE